jgi:hypothetical protein
VANLAEVPDRQFTYEAASRSGRVDDRAILAFAFLASLAARPARAPGDRNPAGDTGFDMGETEMPTSLSTASPSITAMIRLDHMHALAAFHRYHASSPWWRKRAIVNSTCTALEIHAQLEEEIFYPALATVLSDDQTLDKSRPEHDEIRATISRLRAMGPENAAYDALFMQLMREVIHHVADEETLLLPAAEHALKEQLQSLGARMTRRRLQLLGERPVEIAVNTMGTFPVATFVLGSMLAFGIGRCLARHREPPRAG